MSFANFIPEIWSARLLQHLDKVHVYANLMNHDYEGEIKDFGDTVRINQVGDINIFDYDGNDLPDPEDVTGTQKLLVIDQAKAFNFRIKDLDNAQSNPKLMNEAMQRAAYKTNDAIDQFVANLMYVNVHADNLLGSDDAPIVPTAANAYDYLVDLGTLLTESNVDMIGRWVVVPAWYHGLLLKDPRFVGNGTDYNKAILEGGLVGHAAGFAVHVSNNVPNTDKTKYKVIAGTNQAGTYAEQLVEIEPYRQEKNFSDAVKGLNVFGAEITQESCLAVMTANKN